MAFSGYSSQHFINFNALSFTTVEVAIVSGSGPNFCGHALLRIDGYYFHISGYYDYPRFMKTSEYDRYLLENGKEELFSTRRFLQNKPRAMAKLKALTSKRWLWLLIPNNCLSFVEDVVAAGEDDVSLITNCPTLLQTKITRKTAEYLWRTKKAVKP